MIGCEYPSYKYIHVRSVFRLTIVSTLPLPLNFVFSFPFPKNSLFFLHTTKTISEK